MQCHRFPISPPRSAVRIPIFIHQKPILPMLRKGGGTPALTSSVTGPSLQTQHLLAAEAPWAGLEVWSLQRICPRASYSWTGPKHLTSETKITTWPLLSEVSSLPLTVTLTTHTEGYLRPRVEVGISLRSQTSLHLSGAAFFFFFLHHNEKRKSRCESQVQHIYLSTRVKNWHKRSFCNRWALMNHLLWLK